DDVAARHAAYHQQPQVADDVTGQRFVRNAVAINVQPEISTLEAAAIAKGDLEIELDAILFPVLRPGGEVAYDAMAANRRPAANLLEDAPMPRQFMPWLLLIPFMALLWVVS